MTELPEKVACYWGAEYFAATKGPFPLPSHSSVLRRYCSLYFESALSRGAVQSSNHPRIGQADLLALSSPLSRFPAQSDILQRRATAQFFKIKARIITLHSRAVL